jgi:small GTP-binding protein
MATTTKRKERKFHSSCSPLIVSVVFTVFVQGFHVVRFHPTRFQTYHRYLAVNRDLLENLDSAFKYDGRLPSESSDFRCGFVSIIGAPNMGKSTLMNALLQEDLCIATRRPQTTRHAILGVITTTDCQLCLVDTPGIIHQPAYKLQEGMMEAVVTAFKDADVLLVVTDLFSTPFPDDELFHRVQTSQKPVIVVINKVDLADQVKSKIMVVDGHNEQERTVTVNGAIQRWRTLLPNSLAILPLAATAVQNNNTGLIALRKILLGEKDVADALRDVGRPIPGMFRPGVKFITTEEAKALLPPSPPLYDAEALTDRPER